LATPGNPFTKKIIDHLSSYSHGVIINGVGNSQHTEFLCGSDVCTMQGTLWLPYGQEEFDKTFLIKRILSDEWVNSM
jgi:EAL domain-containing protein (putative c-di-GMP-specific phosphodiesterase class I)